MVCPIKSRPQGATQMAYSLYDAAVTPCAQQLGALAGIIDKAAAHCAANKSRVETALAFVKSLNRAQVDGAEDKVIAWTAGANNRKLKGNDYLQQFALPNFFFFVTTAYDILRHRG